MKARLATITLVLPLSLSAQDPAPPLFAAHETLHITIEADFDRIHKDRGEESEYQPARLAITGLDGNRSDLPLRIRTRGNFRLKRSTCKYPPLRLNFPTDSLSGTVFDGQDRLKLVTHCQDQDSSEQNTLEEYLAYRIYNLLTDMSFRVRIARITYVDARGKDDPVERYGILLEDEEAMAKRLGGSMMEVAYAHPMELKGDDLARLGVFQYMIGNTDYSPVFMHNSKLMLTAEGAYVPVPYDFDWSGLVQASYAKPAEKLGTRTVRERVYWGFCQPGIDFGAVSAEFQTVRNQVEELFATTEGLQDESRERGLDYLRVFYEVIDDPKAVERRLLRSCREVPGQPR